ncbi:hypothetical protein KDA_76830 [Dictyobacter alpinus]|uniref:Uncharacterized protein n=2 Tax=Dictyobacter alpinus TaxID=2014873 RepID=A0A402BLJ0_9CHLR|nr:hypothetical protein KDA_76830 [Dictyobacter alpinus]
MFKKDWGITDYKQILNSKYWDTTDKILCNDHWTWRIVEQVTWKTILEQLRWPADLVQPSMLNQTQTVQALSTVDKPTEQQQQQKVKQQQEADAKPRSGCDFVMPVLGWNFHLDACSLLKTIVKNSFLKPIYENCKNVINQAQGFLWTTDPAATYDLGKNTTLAYFHTGMLNLVNIFIVLVLAWIGFRYVLGGGINWLEYAKIQETLPRLLFGLIAAYFAMQIAKVVIDGSNALCTLFHGDMLKHMFDAQSNGAVAATVQVIYVIMGVLLVIEAAARYGILYILLAFLPIILFCSTLKETSHYAKNGIKALILFTFLQPVQLAVMDLGQAVLVHTMTKDPGNILNYLIGISIMLVVLSLFFSVSRMAFSGAFQPLGAMATGAAAGLALGSARLGGKGVLKGRQALNEGADKVIAGMPGAARQAPAAMVGAYQGIKHAPQNFRSGAKSFVDHARSAGTQIAKLTPGYALRHSKPVMYQPSSYTGNAASSIAHSKKTMSPSVTSLDQTTDDHAKGITTQQAAQIQAQIRANKAQYQARWNSHTPTPGNGGKKSS